ncbi:hypothetical protein EV363DRAFT_1252258 [Boletus edulis]|nr:hypothetical protein EV363DRAFT_1252258 [Boletus edulis]
MAYAPSRTIWVRGLWGPSIARRLCPHRGYCGLVSAACMGFGPCTVGIFSCPATATLAGQAVLFLFLHCVNPNLVYSYNVQE